MSGTLSWTFVSWCDLVRLSESLQEKRPMRASKTRHCAVQHGQSIDFLHLDRLKWDWWRWVFDMLTAGSSGEGEFGNRQTGMPLKIYRLSATSCVLYMTEIVCWMARERLKTMAGWRWEIAVAEVV